MKELFTNKYFILLLVVTILLLTAIIMYTADRQSVTFGEDAIGAVVTPVQSLFTSIYNGVGGFFSYFSDIDAVKDANRQMTDEINRLNDKIRNIEYYEVENKNLREMLDLKNSMGDYTLVAAEVISKDPGSWFNSFTINKGSQNGLAYRQPVITSGGLVGHIYEIGTNWAKVVSIIDISSKVGSVVTRTRDTALVESDAELQRQGFCKMTYIEKSASVIEGDIIETSGLGGIYPKGLLIGKVHEIRPENAGISQYAIIKPAVDFERISQVFVIQRYPESDFEPNTDVH